MLALQQLVGGELRKNGERRRLTWQKRRAKALPRCYRFFGGGVEQDHRQKKA